MMSKREAIEILKSHRQRLSVIRNYKTQQNF